MIFSISVFLMFLYEFFYCHGCSSRSKAVEDLINCFGRFAILTHFLSYVFRDEDIERAV